MRRTWLAVAVGAALATPAVAGTHEKCSMAVQECLDAMTTALRNKGWAGLEIDKSRAGSLVVKAVVPGSPAEVAGFRAGDVLIALNGVALAEEKNREALNAVRKALVPGARATYTVDRDGVSRRLVVVLAPMPENIRAAYIGEHMMEHATVRASQR
ncbi:MAG TPA: PDZ domain-containing protein [Vicinamibacteria bacterium]|jgi:S1-C subfamily serine protease